MADEPAHADWAQNLIRDYEDKLTCGLWEVIYRLDRPSLDTLMQAQARTCVGAFLQLGTLPQPLPVDDFLQTMRIAGPSQIDIQRNGDVIEWTEVHRGQCVCPHVRREVVRLDPKLCICGAHWVKVLFEVVARTEVEVEMMETVATGAENCRFRITVKGPAPG